MLVTLPGIVMLVRLVTYKRTIPDAGDAAGNHVTSAYAARKFNERGLALVKQRSIRSAIKCVICFNRYRYQAVQPPNAPSPMLVTLAGMVTLVSPVQLSNASFPMLVTLPGIVTLVRPCRHRTHRADVGDAAGIV